MGDKYYYSGVIQDEIKSVFKDQANVTSSS
jgi:hypothetical protein